MALDLPPIEDSDSLGRAVFSSGDAKDARKGKIRHKIFLENEEVDCLSVDRLAHAPDEEMAEIGDRNARRRGPTRSFYGWATVTVADASEDGRSVRATPWLDNPYHADIDLNIPASVERRDIQNAHANSLAIAAEWRERPPG